jgi:hypothetical protein
MNQHADEALRGALERTAGGLDDNPERYDQVAARLRRRRQRQAVAGVAAAVLLVAGSAFLVTGLPRTGEGEPAGDAATASCPAPVDSVPRPEYPGGWQSEPLVPENPVAVRVCGLLDITLDRDLDRLVSALNSLPPTETVDWACTDEYPGPPYHLVFEYADRDPVTALLEQGNCRTVQVGDQLRLQSDPLIKELVYELAEAQRWEDAPADPPDPTCPDPSTLTRPVGDDIPRPRFDAFMESSIESVPYPAVSVAVCRYDSTDPRSARLVADELVTDGAEEARRLVNDQSPENPFWSCDPPEGWFDVLVFSDEAGGMYEVLAGRGDCRLFYSAFDLSDEPDPGLREWLDATLGDPE